MGQCLDLEPMFTCSGVLSVSMMTSMGVFVGDYDVNLCMSKCRVCPMRGYTIPRSELCGALLVSRLLLAVVTALSRMEEAPASAVMILDSRCVKSNLEMNSSKVLPFFQNRLAEIHENLDAVAKKCEVEPVQWVQTDLNPAD